MITITEDKKLFMGIDPGLHGAIVVINGKGEIVCSENIPLIGSELDLRKLWTIFHEYFSEPIHVVIEQVHAIFGSAASATFTFGRVCGILEGFTVANDFNYTLIQPKVWQKEMFQGIPEIKKPSKSGKTSRLDTKKMAYIAKTRLFPTATGFETPRGKVIDGKVDALLIAEYARRKLA